MTKDKDYRPYILILIPIVWLLYFLASDVNRGDVNDRFAEHETWDIRNLRIENRGGENSEGVIAVFELKKIPINRAGEQLLITIPGVGPELARRIVDRRMRFGHYKTPKDLVKIAGIGPRRMEQFTPYLSFD